MKEFLLKRSKKRVRIIEAESIELAGKDIIVLKTFEDFQWCAEQNDYVLELKGSLYVISSEVAWVYNGIHKNP